MLTFVFCEDMNSENCFHALHTIEVAFGLSGFSSYGMLSEAKLC